MPTKITRSLACALGQPLTDQEYEALMARLHRKGAMLAAAWKLEHLQ